ncbi:MULTISPECIES: hypothetical protein [unclassified Aerococcus]|uniref:hypothetical protein n=1 Tax=unclassified Aerococcus TaxID=2618060 RepID=UPI0008A151E3|nr:MULTISPECIES: hypothetical protein [unclassified Aerococcus]MDK6679217.1 hypothetical protein [Aerococcus sp. UMB8608]MDK6685941.1 hypothetical protein [Aerococcus sp. UMB8623]MDK6939292.1 hypothetical protein [Aerococcus sp. UMB8487]OFK21280.1 hypothetical protein HMPREF2829_03820 [Aerococcus sp. HMSC072A12]OFR32564.1 hypothetical protein HMPREF2892_08095 [Aerococcus sp. HMSC061A03]
MEYITGLHALNIPCQLNTSGDWHVGALDWTKVHTKESNKSIFKDFGIEENKKIPQHTKTYAVANHLRAILDLMDEGHLKFLKGFKNDFFGTDQYNQIFFEKVYLLKIKEIWEDIYQLMLKEFGIDWYAFCLVKGEKYGK